LAERIETAILEGRLAAGTRLGTKDELRRGYGVAYGTLNEALRMLQQRGYLESRSGPGGGLFTTMPRVADRLGGLLLGFGDSATYADCAIVRRALGKQLIVAAAEARTEHDIEELRAIVATMRASMEDDVEYALAIRRFHRRVAAIARNRVLANLYETLQEVRELQRVRRRQPIEERKRHFLVHRRIAEAIASGSVARAARAAEVHEGVYRTTHSKATITRRRTVSRISGERVYRKPRRELSATE
jgi:DNA-binding FadR family transcriptional regulator